VPLKKKECRKTNSLAERVQDRVGPYFQWTVTNIQRSKKNYDDKNRVHTFFLSLPFMQQKKTQDVRNKWYNIKVLQNWLLKVVSIYFFF